MTVVAGAARGDLRAPAYAGYFADPFVLRLDDGTYIAYGTHPAPPAAGRIFDVLVSPDLTSWSRAGGALERLAPDIGDQYWAPEVVQRDGSWWMYYSVGHGIVGHHLRVARAAEPTGPFIDLGVNLTPDETFAIDPHPFQDEGGRWYLYFARDVLDAERPGTHLAVGRIDSPTELTAVVRALEPTADWQLYERARSMYGAVYDWHTLEGPSVVRRHGRYWMTYSGGAWTGAGYAVSWATASHPLGPWESAPSVAPALLATGDGLIGPGHNSLVIGPDGSDVIAFHAWNDAVTERRLHLAPIEFRPDGPVVHLHEPLPAAPDRKREEFS
ncbi:glycoside hydrolase family 43 protein [uncultured Microbacterium sp.]|uniref:glycoside hydrolase family 43 protein n=1 Tax=uncultured Microbacterium sp. TaxID=191216 RepID=UPI0035CBC802